MARSIVGAAEGRAADELTRAERREDLAYRERRHLRARQRYPRATRPTPKLDQRRYHGKRVRVRQRVVWVPRFRSRGFQRALVVQVTRGTRVLASSSYAQRYGREPVEDASLLVLDGRWGWRRSSGLASARRRAAVEQQARYRD